MSKGVAPRFGELYYRGDLDEKDSADGDGVVVIPQGLQVLCIGRKRAKEETGCQEGA